jgi:hypothetical protein
MAFKLTDQQQAVLELVADGPVPAIPEIKRYIARSKQPSAPRSWMKPSGE